MQPSKLSFSQRHPLLLCLVLIMAAMALFAGAVAAFRLTEGTAVGSLFRESRLGICYVRGTIMDASRTVAWLRELRDDASVKGVLVRINSPGGAVAPSQELYSAVKRLAEHKPVVVSMGTAAASGGYYIAVAADYIVANPSSLTGSIGVKMELANMEGLMEKLGVGRTALTSGALKDAGTPFRPMTEKDRAYLQGLVADMYEQFIEAVVKGRRMSDAAVRAVADGRALTGRQAYLLGLVDELGDMETAQRKLAQLADVPTDTPYVEEPPEKTSLLRELLTVALGLAPASLADIWGTTEGIREDVRFLYR